MVTEPVSPLLSCPFYSCGASTNSVDKLAAHLIGYHDIKQLAYNIAFAVAENKQSLPMDFAALQQRLVELQTSYNDLWDEYVRFQQETIPISKIRERINELEDWIDKNYDTSNPTFFHASTRIEELKALLQDKELPEGESE